MTPACRDLVRLLVEQILADAESEGSLPDSGIVPPPPHAINSENGPLRPIQHGPTVSLVAD